MNKKEFLDFLAHHEAPPAEVEILARKDILLSFKSRSIIGRFLFFQLIGALFSLSVCPQFGIGLVDGHGITHVFRMIGDWACAFFCGSLFLSSGLAVAFIAMKGEELWWVWQRYKYSLILLPTLLWGSLMLTNVSFNLSQEAPSYHLIWVLAAILVQALWLQLRSSLYQSKILHQG